MKHRILSTLLHYANSDPPTCGRREFYDFKLKLLLKYGTPAGEVIQEIRKDCWGPGKWNERWGDYDYQGCSGDDCPRCGGTGIFDIRWIRLQVWKWGKFIFHVPVGETRTPIKFPADIYGRIEHEHYGDRSQEACLWLCLLCGQFKLFWRACSGRRCGWYWWPLMNVQRVIMEAKMRLRWPVKRRRCFCGKRFITVKGYGACRVCRKKPVDIPF